MMILLATDWGQAWTMAGISVGVVFAILVLLVLVLTIFSVVAGNKGKKAVAVADKVAAPQSVGKGSAADEAAVATAVYLYLNSRHDDESGVLTIRVNDNSLWHEELNDRL